MKAKQTQSRTKLPTDPRGWIIVRKVRNGRGLIATRSFRTGQLIAQIEGKVVTAEEVWGYWEVDERLGANCIRFDDDHFLNPDGHIGAFANHSCNPNTALVKRGRKLIIKAIAPIAAGDELTHDYSTYIGKDDVWTMRCNCGEENCRSVVKNFSKLPKAILARYKKLGAIPKFILQT
jgi:hypothetical protein